MRSSTAFIPTFALAAIAVGSVNAALAQATAQTPASGAAATTTTTTTTVAAPTQSDAATQPSASVTKSAAGQSAPIGATGLDRADSANAAFAKLDATDRGFLSRAEVAKLPGFGNAFAQADRDGDGRLDRTEFTDAWSVYIDQAAVGETTTTTTAVTPSR